MQCLQEQHAPTNRCFGCGPANPRGLRIQSHPEGDELIAHWRPEPHHAAFTDILNGGIIGTLLDCHANWTAAWHLMITRGVEFPPSTVTSDFHIRLRRPTPTTGVVTLRTHVEVSDDPRVHVVGTLEAEGVITATVKGLFVAVTEGHPAFHRWD